MRPFVLPPNLQCHFYSGGGRIGELRGLRVESDHVPEEWIGAVNSAFGEPERGLSRLADGTLLRDALTANPRVFLGGRHLERFGADPCLLVKLIDAGERLPVHFHPGRAFAREALNSKYGKTEAWIVIDAAPGAAVHVGFARDIGLEQLRGWIDAQDADAMLSALRRIPVATGDTVFVPAGTPHAIGAGILLLELQEPTDFSVLLEWRRFGLSEDGSHLHLGWPRALGALDRSAWDDDRVGAALGSGPRILPVAADPYFRAERVSGGQLMDACFAILVVLDGAGSLSTARGGDLAVHRGDSLLVPHAAGDSQLHGAVSAIRCRPPDPSAGELP